MIALKRNSLKSSQQGAVLFITLIFMLLLTMIATTVTQTSTMEVKMAGNQQFSEEARQMAQALNAAILSDEAHFVVTGGVGFTNCEAGGGCDLASIVLPGAVTTASTGVTLDYYTERMAPLTSKFSARLVEGQAFGANSFEAARFEVVGSYDGADSGFGQSVIVVGAMKRIAASQQ